MNRATLCKRRSPAPSIGIVIPYKAARATATINRHGQFDMIYDDVATLVLARIMRWRLAGVA